MSDQSNNEATMDAATKEQEETITDLEPRKMGGANDTFETTASSDEEEDDSYNSEDDDVLEGYYEDNGEGGEEQLSVKDAAMDVIGQLVELFEEKNGRPPNEEEVKQWIETFQSLDIRDNDERSSGENAAAASE